MQSRTLWRGLLGVEKTVVEDVGVDELGDVVRLVAHVRPTSRARSRCGVCGRRSGLYDRGEGRRRWRGLDFGEVQVFLESDAPRVRCRDHGIVVARVPWARHRAGHTFAFDQQVAWLATQTSKTAACELMRIAWRTVGAIITRYWADTAAAVDQFAGLRKIGIDEISYKKGHKYLTVVVDHDTGRLVCAAPGRDKATLNGFFDALAASGEHAGEDRCGMITHVSADGAEWIAAVVTRRCPNAVRCADPFHVVKWATDALDEVRRDVWNTVRGAVTQHRAGRSTGEAKQVKNARWALWKNPEDLTEKQTVQLRWIAKTSPRLYRAYLLKEGLRAVFKLPLQEATEALEKWLSWARRCRISAFVKLARSIRAHLPAILAAIEHGLSNGRIESVNTKIRLITRIAFGFRSPQALIALAMLNLGGHRPTLPGRP
ncbi:ISL3 family transposase [Actinomyces culturomici]|uniref:ISL3 family transposase n=1 Tax=Actinomyces culturomici TaxID=1926276 RepID=UPI000E204CD4|nr:ISL3 family transposase [Actinomyces culturomici]